MSELHVFKNYCDWVVAESIDDAYSWYEKTTGLTRADQEVEDDPFAQVADSTTIKIWAEPDGTTTEPGGPGVTLQERTAAEWARLNGPGLLASTEY